MKIDFAQARKKRAISAMKKQAELQSADKSVFKGMATIFGADDELRGFVLLNALALSLERSRAQNPLFAGGAPQALGQIGAAYDDLARAVEKGSVNEQFDKIMLLATAVMRMLANEHGRRPHDQ